MTRKEKIVFVSKVDTRDSSKWQARLVSLSNNYGIDQHTRVEAYTFSASTKVICDTTNPALIEKVKSFPEHFLVVIPNIRKEVPVTIQLHSSNLTEVYERTYTPEEITITPIINDLLAIHETGFAPTAEEAQEDEVKTEEDKIPLTLAEIQVLEAIKTQTNYPLAWSLMLKVTELKKKPATLQSLKWQASKMLNTGYKKN